jgi:hypothetical protein
VCTWVTHWTFRAPFTETPFTRAEAASAAPGSRGPALPCITTFTCIQVCLLPTDRSCAPAVRATADINTASSCAYLQVYSQPLLVPWNVTIQAFVSFATLCSRVLLICTSPVACTQPPEMLLLLLQLIHHNCMLAQALGTHSNAMLTL